MKTRTMLAIVIGGIAADSLLVALGVGLHTSKIVAIAVATIQTATIIYYAVTNLKNLLK